MAAVNEAGDVFMSLVVECVGPDGRMKWRDECRNLVTTAGKNDLLTQYFKGSGYTASWFLLLKGTGAPDVADTLASHASWSELTPYSGNRPSVTFGTASAGSLSGNQVAISINGSAAVAGAGLCTVNTGTSGVLYNAANFSASRAVESGDTLNITPTLTMA